MNRSPPPPVFLSLFQHGPFAGGTGGSRIAPVLSPAQNLRGLVHGPTSDRNEVSGPVCGEQELLPAPIETQRRRCGGTGLAAVDLGLGGDLGWWWGRQRSAEGSPGGWEGGWVASRAPALGPSDFFSWSEKSYKSEQSKT